MSTCPEFPDGGHAYLAADAWPLVTVRFPDGGQADFRTGGEWPRNVEVRYNGLEVNGMRVDITAGVHPDGEVWHSSVHKTDVAGADGGYDIPVKVQEKATALVRRRAREARSALWTAGRGKAA